MRCPLCRIPAFRRLRSRLAQIFALSLLVALIGCDETTAPSGDSAPTAPTALADVAPLATLANNRIAFLSYTNEESDIYTITPAGGGLTKLTSFAGSEWDPAWSYNHQRLAFVRWRADANKGMHGDIYLMNADGTGKRWARSSLPSYYLSEPSWSPDGKRLVLTLQLVSGGTMYLATMDLSTGNLAWVAPKGVVAVQGHSASWDPTGTAILYIDPTGEAVHRFVPGGNDEILLTHDLGIRDFMLSPDRTRLAYTGVVTGSNDEIFVLTLATKVIKRLTSNAVVDRHVSWSPDGTRLAFQSRRSGAYQVWTMNGTTGGGLTQVTKIGSVESPVWWH